MIAFLQGILAGKEEQLCYVDVQGVGYRVEISTQTSDNLPSEGAETRLLIHHHFTESDQRLFGFLHQSEKTLFEQLITVKGIGPKLALTILSGMPASNLVDAIAGQDTGALSSISGIGKKTAERMVLELKDKLFEGAAAAASTSGGAGGVRQEAISALEALGFGKRGAEKTVAEILQKEKDLDVSAVVKAALSEMKR
ncbi:MAG: Holliday junction branch migration protein RuvA [Balneolaceae bacterium]